MLSSTFAEDIFEKFYNLVDMNAIRVQHQDFSPILSFYTKIVDKNQLTQNQANYIYKILEKYKNVSAEAGLDYRPVLQNLQWRQPFRVLDLSKRLYVEVGSNGRIDVCLKFPYQLKKEFEDEILPSTSKERLTSQWDQEAKVRRLNIYDNNLISLYEFAMKHNFEIDESFMNALSEVEEIWQNAEEIVPCSVIVDNSVQLKNATPEAQQWWEQHSSKNVSSDLLLAKSMGFQLQKNPENLVEKIASNTETSFWVRSNDMFFSLYNEVDGKVCIILDRTSDALGWLKNFVADADVNGVSRDDIRVCFRASKEDRTGLNEWIKTAGVGGKVESGKILIFESKPAKWLFKDEQDIKMLVTNNIYPPTNTLTREWFSGHTCVVYLGNTRPTEQRGQKIVEL